MLSMLSGDLAITALVSAIAFVAVWVPLHRGLRVCLTARAATRSLNSAELRQCLGQRSKQGVEPVAVVMTRVLGKSLRAEDRGAYPSEFVLDASKQYVLNEYDAHYSQLISMYAGILPPIGFIGTTGGLLILFLSMHASNSSLELGALAMALTSSIFALVGFAILEGLKIKLYARLLACIDPDACLRAVAEEAKARAAKVPTRPATATAR